MKQFYVYLHCRPNGIPFYVGKGFGNRAYDLNPCRRSKNKHHKNIVAKFGIENILIYTRSCESEYQAKVHEVWIIAWCRAQGYRLTNMTDGGEGTAGFKYSEEQMQQRKLIYTSNSFKEKIAAKVKAHWAGMSKAEKKKRCKAISGHKRTPEQIEKLRRSHLGKPSPMKGKVSSVRVLSHKDDLRVSVLYLSGKSTRQLAVRFDVSRPVISASLKRTKTAIRAQSFWHRSYK